MAFGTQTVELVRLTKTGDPDELGNYEMTAIVTPLPGCRHRPLTFKETAELEVNIATEMWRSTIPTFDYSADLLAVVLDARANDVISVDGQDYQIVGGIRHHVDMSGNPFKATIISKKHVG